MTTGSQTVKKQVPKKIMEKCCNPQTIEQLDKRYNQLLIKRGREKITGICRKCGKFNWIAVDKSNPE